MVTSNPETRMNHPSWAPELAISHQHVPGDFWDIEQVMEHEINTEQENTMHDDNLKATRLDRENQKESEVDFWGVNKDQRQKIKQEHKLYSPKI